MAISNYVLSLSMALAISNMYSPLKVHADTVRPARISQNKQMHAFVYRDSQDLLASGSIAKEKLAVKDSRSNEKPNKNGVNLDWQNFDDSLFVRAKKENKFVLLDLEAVWCHWCHVMDKKTYSHPLVAEIIKSKFIPVKVDQDSRPDLSHRYEDYGWPATIIFDADGNEIVKRSGYIRAQRMIRLLNAIIADPSPEDKPPKKFEYNRKGSLSEPLKQELLNRHIKGYDTEHGAWGRFHKFLDWDSVEYAMELGEAGDKQSAKRAVKTLEAQLNLMDPVWGGVYQYSTDGDWKHPHFEKIMQMQAENLRIYSLGYNLYRQDEFLNAAKDIARYLNTFLSSPTGAFYTSQDADLKPGEHSSGYFDLGDKKRRALGIPRIDKHIYARENGWAINGLPTYTWQQEMHSIFEEQ